MNYAEISTILIQFLTNTAFSLSLFFLIKCLFAKSLVLDRITNICIPILAAIGPLSSYAPGILSYILTALRFGAFIYLILRGGKGKWKRIRSFFETLLFLLFSCFGAAASLAYLFDTSVFYNGAYIGNNREASLFMLFSLTCIFLYSCFGLYRKNIFISLRRWDKFVLGIYSLYCLGMACMFSIYSQNGTSLSAALRSVVTIPILVFVFAVPLLVVSRAVTAYYREGQEYQNRWLELELKHFHDYKQAQEDTARFRHDIKNHLLCLDAILKEDRYNEAKEYLNNLVGQVKELSPRVVTGNDLLDCIVQKKWDIMLEKGIQFQLDGVLDKGLPWQPTDICAVFANALDNAIEACDKITDDKKKEIRMNIRFTKYFYNINIENTVAQKPELSLLEQRHFTDKKDIQHHGYGLDNIRRSINKYGGTTAISCSDTHFRLSLVIPAGSTGEA